jgi:NADPH-dependent glutamate synthase beta subunit-like oxidoreductase
MDRGFSLDQALAEASRCLLCHDPPCSADCPAGTDPGRFIRKLRFGNVKGAIAVIKQNNPLGGVCGAICPTCSLCERGCLASGITSPIRIGKIQRFLVEYGWQVGFNPISSKPSNGKKVGIIGAGPSGLTCAAELAKDGYQVIVFERLPRAGGMLQYVIPEHRLTSEFVDREISEIVDLGVEIRPNTAIETQEDLDRLLEEGCEALYLATGTWKCTKPDLVAADSEDIFDAISFLRLAKETSEKFVRLVEAKDVAVIGGGDSALDAAVTAKECGARDVLVVYRRSYTDMPASQEAKELALAKGVHLVILTQPVDYIIEEGRVRGVRVVRCGLGESDETGRRCPVLIRETEHTLEAGLIVEALGLVPDEAIRQISSLEVDRLNRVVIKGEGGGTSVKRIFAGGDAVRGASLVTRAISDGKKAAAAMRQMLEKGGR